jgi:dipeptidyl aminopeptidase/acylaminoacyl peptidase
MKKLSYIALAIVSFCFSCKQPETTVAARIPKQYSSEQLRNNVTVEAAGFNGDESGILLSNNQTGIFNAYQVNIADSNSMPLTHSATDSWFGVSYLPGSNSSLLVTHDQGGDENNHLYLLHKGDTTARDLTPWLKSANNFFGWSKDKKFAYISSNHRNPKYFDLWKLDTSSWTPVLLFQNDSGYEVAGTSPGERYVALVKSITTDKNELYLFDRSTKQLKKISNDTEATWSAAAMEKGDSILYYITNNGNEFSYVVRYNINTGASSKYFEDKWDVVGMSLSENEKYHTILVNDDGRNKVLLFEHATAKPIQFPNLGDREVQDLVISPSEKNIALTAGSSTSPADIYNYSIESGTLKQLTKTLNPEVDQADLVKAEVIRFKSFDGKEIPAIYYKPLQASDTSKSGALVFVHGGPGGQSRAGYSNTIQFLVNHGYAILAVNNRGSSGYGKTFYKLDNRDHGYGDLNDCIWAKKWLASQNYIDSNAIGIYGGSYGGNMVLNALCMHPDEFKLGVDLFGVANWMRTLKSIPPYWESFRKALYDEMGDPNTKDSVLLKATSPLYNYQKITKPLIVFQGENDVRVLKIESDEIAAGVKKNGVPVEYIVYPQEGHGFRKKENQISTDKKTLAFLEQYLKPVKAAKANSLP